MQTPARGRSFLWELMSGFNFRNPRFICGPAITSDTTKSSGYAIVEFHSLCEDHLLPFTAGATWHIFRWQSRSDLSKLGSPGW